MPGRWRQRLTKVLTATIPMYNPYCSCKPLTDAFAVAAAELSAVQMELGQLTKVLTATIPM